MRGALSETMVMPKDFAAVRELASVTRTVKELVPTLVGVPEITPVLAASVNPAGRLPAVIVQE